MKILFITPVVPYPPHRGDKLRIYNVIKSLAVNHEVKIIFFARGEEERKNAHDLRALGYNVDIVEFSKWKAILHLYRSIIFLQPLQVAFHFSKKMFNLISAETKKTTYDFVYFHLYPVAQYYKAVDKSIAFKILDLTDASSLYLKRYLEFLSNPIKKLFFRYEYAMVNRYEYIAKKFDATYVCSNTDREYLQKKVNRDITLFTNGIDVDTFKPRNTKIEKGRIIFAGSMPYFPNKDAVLFFANEVFPLVLKQKPAAKFYIVGKNPPPEIAALASEKIIVTGFVNDIVEEYAKSEVNVAPIRFGAGIQNKIIEALAVGVPTVTSTMSIKALPLTIQSYVLTADLADDFANKVLRIMNDESFRSVQMVECSELIRKIMNWDNIVKEQELEIVNRIDKKNNIKSVS